MLVRSFDLIGVTSLNMASLPAANLGPVTPYTYPVRYVSVSTCPAASSPCQQKAAPDVQIKMQLTGSTWKILSWSEQR